MNLENKIEAQRKRMEQEKNKLPIIQIFSEPFIFK